jgi:hypothetical protein
MQPTPEPTMEPSLLLFLMPHGWWLTLEAMSLPRTVLPYNGDALSLLYELDLHRLPDALEDVLAGRPDTVYDRGRVGIEVRDYTHDPEHPTLRHVVLLPTPLVRACVRAKAIYYYYFIFCEIVC